VGFWRWISVLALVLALGSDAWAGPPTETLDQTFVTVNRLLEDPALQEKPPKLLEAIRKVVIDCFDVRQAASLALGREWHTRTSTERDEFVQLFGDLLEQAYVSRIASRATVHGGLAIRYLHTDEPPSIQSYVATLAHTVKAKLAEHRLSPPTLSCEPGRSIVGDAGVTLYTVGAIKAIPGVRTYVSVDGGMFENPRPALYGARYEAVMATRPEATPTQTAAVAGRCCESGDVLVWDAQLPEVKPGDVLATFSTGAYTYSMASNYNRFPRPAVVLVGSGRARVVVERETYDDMIRKDVAL